uniref:Uncharacterized protein n=1 Tax=uncultured bacterium contig00026 TaxID=1181515 RepID=A0A806KJM4_9BACT|nr:hypothetical protein [uncultured bacterium contig00026]
MGCGGDGDGNDPPPDTEGWVRDLVEIAGGPFTLKLANNYQYGDGYQGMMALHPVPDLLIDEFLDGYRIMKGNRFTLEMEFTFDKPFDAEKDKDMEIGLVDATQQAWIEYWGPLTWQGENGVQKITIAELAAATPGVTVISKTFDYTALQNASSVAPRANDLAFQFESTRGRRGDQNNAAVTAQEITLTFSKFILTKLPDIEIEDCCTVCILTVCEDCLNGLCGGDEGCGIEWCLPFVDEAVYGGTKLIIDLNGTPTDVNLTPRAFTDVINFFEDNTGYKFTRGNGWSGSFAQFILSDLTQYSKVTFKYQGLSGDITSKGVKLVARPGTTALIGTQGQSIPQWFGHDSGEYIVSNTVDVGTPALGKNSVYEVELNLDPAKIADCNDIAYVSIYIHSNASATVEDEVFPTAWKIWDIKFE